MEIHFPGFPIVNLDQWSNGNYRPELDRFPNGHYRPGFLIGNHFINSGRLAFTSQRTALRPACTARLRARAGGRMNAPDTAAEIFIYSGRNLLGMIKPAARGLRGFRRRLI